MNDDPSISLGELFRISGTPTERPWWASARDVVWDVRDYSEAAKAYLDIEAHNHDPIVDQGIFAFGDPGTEAGHTLDSNSVDRTVNEDGNGNYAFFLRIELDQTRATADQNLTRTYKLQYAKNGGSWTDVTATSSNVRVAGSTPTDGEATTNRISGSVATFLAGDYDEGDGTLDAITWTASTVEHTESLWSLEVVDADMAATNTLDFRVLESGGTLLNNDATSDKPRLSWEAAAGSIEELTAAPDGVATASTPRHVNRIRSAAAAGIASTVVAMGVIAGLGAIQADGVGATTSGVDTIRSVAAQADGVATTTVSIAKIIAPTEFTAQADGVATADASDVYRRVVVASEGALTSGAAVTLDVFRQAHRDTQADGVGTATAAFAAPDTQKELTASADGVATADASDIFRRVVVASEGSLDSGAFVTAFFETEAFVGVIAADGVGTASATLYKRVILGYVGEASGVATVTVYFDAPGVSHTLTAAPDGVATAAVSVTAIRSLAASADGVATTTTPILRQAHRDTQADGVAAVTLDSAVVRGADTQADGVATVTLDLAVIRELGDVQADGVATATAEIQAGTTITLTAQADGVATTTTPTLRQAHRDTQADGVGATTVTVDRIASRDTQADGAATVTLDVAVVRALETSSDGVATLTLAMTAPESATAFDGKYAAEHREAYLTLLDATGFEDEHADAYLTLLDATGFEDEHADALRDITAAGVEAGASVGYSGGFDEGYG